MSQHRMIIELAHDLFLFSKGKFQHSGAAVSASLHSSTLKPLGARTGQQIAEYGEWNRKGATLSDVTAKADYGVDRDFIVKGIEERKT